MAEASSSTNWVVRVARDAMVASLVIVGVAIIATVAAMVDVLLTDGLAAAAGLIALVALEGVLVTWSIVAYAVVRTIVALAGNAASIAARVDRLESLAASSTEATHRLTDLVSLTDQAKRFLFREREIEAFREVIHGDILRQDYATAEALIESLEKQLGYADEAARLREEFEQNKQASLEEKVDAAVARIEQIIARHDWARALRETHRILRLFPDNEKIAALPERIANARQQHKRELLQAYGEAVRVNDVDRSIELLKKLDLYLTPQEAAALEESARGIFKAKQHNLGVQFAIHVTDEEWQRAVETGEEIIREFPNSRMAQEVHSKMDQLRARAAGEAPEQ